jgi:hypothetical protein
MYWLTATFFMLLDYTQWPAFLYKYKIQVGKNAPPDTKKVIQVGSQAIVAFLIYRTSCYSLNDRFQTYALLYYICVQMRTHFITQSRFVVRNALNYRIACSS